MHMKIRHYEPRHHGRSFTTATEKQDCVEVQEWEYLAPAVAEEVLEVEIPTETYERVAASLGGDEHRAQAQIVGEARHAREKSFFGRHLMSLL